MLLLRANDGNQAEQYYWEMNSHMAHFKPYRMIYRIIEKHVYVYVIADGRRNVDSLLAHRLLNA